MTESDTFAEQARPASSQRTPDEVRAQLQQWFAAREPGAEVLDLHLPEGNGMSSETLLAAVRFGDEERRLVIRVAPRPESDPVFPTYDLPAQFAVMRHVESYGVAAPSCLWVEEDPAVIGAPFLVWTASTATSRPTSCPTPSAPGAPTPPTRICASSPTPRST